MSFADTTAQGPTFGDMPDNWSKAALEKAVENGLLKGYKEGDKTLIKAENPLTRAELAAVVNRAFNALGTADIRSVADVPETAWYAGDISKAVKMGTLALDAKMRPDDKITRQEAFAVLSRAFKLSGTDGDYKALDKFSDKADIASWALKDLDGLAAAGYIKGSGGKLNPKANITRAEFAVVMDSLVAQYIDEAGTVTEVAASGNVMVRVPGVTLKNLTVKGDLILGDGVGEGDVTLDSVTVEGRTLVRGGGENSVIITGNSDLTKIIVAKVDGKVRIYVEGNANVEIIFVDDGSDDVIVQGRVGTIEVAANDVTVTAVGAIITNGVVSGDNSKIVLTQGSTITNRSVEGDSSEIISGGTQTGGSSGPRPDTDPPVLQSVAPLSGAVELDYYQTFVLTVDAADNRTLAKLEVDHSLSATLPEFSVYADAANPYGSAEAKAEFEEDYGATVTYDSATQKWTIDFGEQATAAIVENGGITFYLVLEDAAGNKWGSMDPTTPENTFSYTVTQVSLLYALNASQLRWTEENQAEYILKDVLAKGFGLEEAAAEWELDGEEQLSEIVSLFWFDYYHYQDKFQFESLESAEQALDNILESYAEILDGIRRINSDLSPVEAVQAYLSSAQRLAGTSSDEGRSFTDEITEMAALAEMGFFAVNEYEYVEILEPLAYIIGSIDGSMLESLSEFLLLVSERVEELGAFEGNDSPDTSKSIVVGEPITAWVYPDDDTDWYSFAAEAGKVYRITTSNLGGPGDDMDTYLYLYDSDEVLIDENDDIEFYLMLEDEEADTYYYDSYNLSSEILWACETPGTYYIRVIHYDNSEYSEDFGPLTIEEDYYVIGRYDLTVNTVEDHIVNGGFEEGDFTGWVVNHGGAFPKVQGDVTNGDSAFAAFMSDGAAGVSWDDSFAWASISQRVWVEDVESLPLLTLAYNVEGSDSGYDGMSLYINGEEVAFWDEDTDGWTSFSHVMTGYGAEPKTLLSDDTGQAIDIMLLCWTWDSVAPVNYYVDDISVDFTDTEQGEANNDPLTAVSLTPGTDVLYSVIYPSTDEDWYKFQAEAGVPYLIETSGLYPPYEVGAYMVTDVSLFDTDQVTVIDNSISEEEYNDSGFNGSRILFIPKTSGTYYLRVVHHYGEFEEAVGLYGIGIRIPEAGDVPETAVALAVDGSVGSYEIDPYNDIDWFKFVGEAGKTYVIRTDNLIPTPEEEYYMVTDLNLLYMDEEEGPISIDRSSSDNQPMGMNGSLIVFTPEAADTYYLSVVHYYGYYEDFEEAVGSYDILILEDSSAPDVESVSPAQGPLVLEEGETFILTVDASDNSLLAELEIDHSLEATLPEFSLYANADNPYGDDEGAFADAGVTAAYDMETQTWTIDFGEEVTSVILENGGITFYLVIKDMAGNQFGTMYETTPENTFVYLVTRETPDV